MTGNLTDAEDLLQDAFLIAFRSLGQLKDPLQFGGWLKRIVVNECIRFGKKNIHWDEWDDDKNRQIAEEDIEWWKTVSFGVIHQEIKELPEGCRQVFNLYVVEDYSHKEIAQMLDIEESTSRSQCTRAKTMLETILIKKKIIEKPAEAYSLTAAFK